MEMGASTEIYHSGCVCVCRRFCVFVRLCYKSRFILILWIFVSHFRFKFKHFSMQSMRKTIDNPHIRIFKPTCTHVYIYILNAEE